MSYFKAVTSNAYFLIGGMIIGKFTNLFSDIIIAGMALYIVTPNIFTQSRLENTKDYFLGWMRPAKNLIDNYQTLANNPLLLNNTNNPNITNSTNNPNSGNNVKIEEISNQIPQQNIYPNLRLVPMSPLPLPVKR